MKIISRGIKLCFALVLIISFGVSFSSCNGMFGFIYDEPITDNQYGFIEVNTIKNTGTIYLDARSYTSWIYIDFHNQTVDSVDFLKQTIEPNEWDIAIHRYDVKTNGAVVMATNYKDFPELWATNGAIGEAFYPDVKNDSVLISFDMGTGELLYYPSQVNRVFNWVEFSLETMPPTYTSNHNVFIVRLKDQTLLALRLESYANDQAQKGFMTIKYCYPLTFN